MAISALFSSSWQLLKDKWQSLLSVGLVGLAVGLGLLAVFLIAIVMTISSVMLLGVILLILFIIAALFLGGWLNAALIKVLANHDQAIKSAWPLAGGMILVGLLCGLIIMAGYILLVIPGIIFSVWYSQAAYAYLLEGRTGVAALNRSKEMVQGRFWAVWGRMLLVSIPVYLISGLNNIDKHQSGLSGIGLLTFIAVVAWELFATCYKYQLYQALKATENKTVA
jgi:hypothetical protein